MEDKMEKAFEANEGVAREHKRSQKPGFAARRFR
jgi:hypothetical protein